MTHSNHSIGSLFGIFLMLAVVFSPLVSADDPPATLTADILTDWTDDGTGNVRLISVDGEINDGSTVR